VIARRTLLVSVIRTVAIYSGYRKMKTIWGILVLVNAVTFAATAKAAAPTEYILRGNESVNWLQLHKGREVKVEISDQVKGGCWTNIDAVKTAVELEFKRSGFKIADGNTSPVFIKITSLGYALNNLDCVATYELDVVYFAKAFYNPGGRHGLQSLADDSIWSKNGLLTGPKSNFSGRLKKIYVDMTQQFINQIDTSRKAIIKKATGISYIDPEAKTFWSNYILD